MRERIQSFLLWSEDEPPHVPLAGLRWWLKGIAVRMHPHLRVRYYPVLSHLRRLAAREPDLRVLEVGAGSLGITRYWRRPVTGVDIDFTGPRLGYLRPVYASAEELPFPDDSFEIVISVDMLEHLEPSVREKAVREMLRVASREVLVGLPCGDSARECERWARSLCTEMASGRRDARHVERIERRAAFLAEHAECGLPAYEDIVWLMQGWGAAAGHEVRVETFGNEPVWYWRLMLPSVVPLHGLSATLARIAGTLIRPLLPLLPQGHAYRTFFLAHKGSTETTGA